MSVNQMAGSFAPPPTFDMTFATPLRFASIFERVTHPPANRHSAFAQQIILAGPRPREPRHYFAVPDFKKRTVQAEPVCMDAFVRAFPVEFCRDKCFLRRWIGDPLAAGGILEFGEFREFIPTAFTDQPCEFGLEVAKERERLRSLGFGATKGRLLLCCI
jgi:hypothetical protein